MLNTCGLILKASMRARRFRCTRCKLSNDTEKYYSIISPRISKVMLYVPNIFRSSLSFVGSVRSSISLTTFEP